MQEGLKKSYSSKWWENKFHVLHREVLLVLIANQAFYQLILPKSNTLKAKLWEKKMHMMLKKEKDQWVMDDNHWKTVKNIHKKNTVQPSWRELPDKTYFFSQKCMFVHTQGYLYHIPAQ